ncbi:MAG: histidinol-phosphate transaminase [Candidatus Omnitrophica bacterium]|nr:histidinol-phosphate transaminase [Candidatus Omnitrophota bacterium]
MRKSTKRNSNWKKRLGEIKPYKPGKPIEEVRREIGLKKVIKLASNENPFFPPKGVVEAIRRAASDVNRYPDGGSFYLKKALSGKLKIAPGNIVLGNGSDELIVLAIRAFVHPGEEVVVAKPTFLIYHIASMVEGAVVRAVPLKDMKYDMEAMRKAITPRTKMVFVANPDNPTGTYVNKPDLERFIRSLPRHVVLFLDEAYYEFARGGDYPETLMNALRKDKDIIVARTFSKAYSLAGLRIGYAVSREEIADVLNKVREPFNINSIAQAAALAALEDRTGHVKKAVDLATKGKKELYEVFNDLGLEYVPSRSNFVLVNVERNSTRVFEYLLTKGVIVRDMSGWGLPGFIRVNVGLPRENKVFIREFRKAMKEIAKS